MTILKIDDFVTRYRLSCRRHASLDLLMKKYPKRLGAKYVLCAEDVFEEGGVTYLPFYMAHCLQPRPQ